MLRQSGDDVKPRAIHGGQRADEQHRQDRADGDGKGDDAHNATAKIVEIRKTVGND